MIFLIIRQIRYTTYMHLRGERHGGVYVVNITTFAKKSQ